MRLPKLNHFAMGPLLMTIIGKHAYSMRVECQRPVPLDLEGKSITLEGRRWKINRIEGNRFRLEWMLGYQLGDQHGQAKTATG